MKFLNRLFNKIILTLQITIILIFILFEEIIWESLAKPIYNLIHSLKIVQKLEIYLQKINNFVALFIFTLLLIIVEGAGVLAGLLFIKGQIIMGSILYITKIPLAGFTFWIFKVTRDKMLSFSFVLWVYNKLISLFNWIKSRELYIKTIKRLKEIKIYIKKIFIPKKSGIFVKLKKIYRAIKMKLKDIRKDNNETNKSN
ncbi:Bll5565 protein [hydrothermal vent metagenome]|uniref:Bll5565 protein n=1 Tax=hydrothermal vent metagenome TaxID=652676 RepID=A0A1W1EL97_9ZZZZ